MQRCWDHDSHLRPEVSEVLQVLTLSVSRSSWPLPIHQLDHFPVCSENSAWKRLTNHNLTTNERVSLIKMVFSHSDQVRMVQHLDGDDAQDCVDTINEVSTRTVSPLGDRLVDSRSNFYTVLIRCWIASNRRSA